MFSTPPRLIPKNWQGGGRIRWICDATPAHPILEENVLKREKNKKLWWGKGDKSGMQ